MERVLLTWSPQNWLTVVLMGALGYLLVSLVWSFLKKVPLPNMGG